MPDLKESEGLQNLGWRDRQRADLKKNGTDAERAKRMKATVGKALTKERQLARDMMVEKMAEDIKNDFMSAMKPLGDSLVTE